MRLRVSRIAAVFVCFLIASAFVSAQATEIVYVTKTGSKYHRADCSSLRSSKIATSLEAAAARHQPCKICKPPLPGATSALAATPATSPSAKATPVQRAVELNWTFDYCKIDLADDALEVRLDVRAKLIDLQTSITRGQQAA